MKLFFKWYLIRFPGAIALIITPASLVIFLSGGESNNPVAFALSAIIMATLITISLAAYHYSRLKSWGIKTITHEVLASTKVKKVTTKLTFEEIEDRLQATFKKANQSSVSKDIFEYKLKYKLKSWYQAIKLRLVFSGEKNGMNSIVMICEPLVEFSLFEFGECLNTLRRAERLLKA